jgi:predicted ATPase/DNA-binding SARP family transcriptional activator
MLVSAKRTLRYPYETNKTRIRSSIHTLRQDIIRNGADGSEYIDERWKEPAMTMTLELLGTLRLIEGGREAQRAIESDNGRALLAYLALEADRPHTRSALAGLLWPDEAEATARHNLAQALFNLRRALHDQRGAQPIIIADRTTLQWNSESSVSVDTMEAEALLAACAMHEHSDARTCAICAQRRERVVALHRGPLLDGFVGRSSDLLAQWLDRQRRRWETVLMEQLVALAAYEIARGAPDRAVPYLVRVTELDPLDEEAYQRLFEVLGQTADRAEIVAHYGRLRAVLDAELGVEPALETEAAYRRAVEQSSVPHPQKPRLPITGPCIGRDAELAAIGDILRAGTRLVTLTGPGGIGKTRLALELAQRSQGDAFFVALAALETPREVAHAIAETVGCPLDPADETWKQTVRWLGERSMLLVLDNFEHLQAAVPMVLDILAHTTNIAVIVTSRARLQLRGETVFPLGGLEATDEGTGAGAALFITAARRSQATFAPSADEYAIIERICRALGGTPLAIELAAGWIGTLSCREIKHEIVRDADILRSSLRDLPARHQSMRRVFDHSWALLPAEERRMLRQLAVFRDGFEHQAALAVVHDGGTDVPAHRALDRLQVLVERSVCRTRTTPDGSTRYDFHPLVRHYAEEHLLASLEQRVTQRRHAMYFLGMAERAHAATGPERVRAWSALDRDVANIRSALALVVNAEAHAESALRFVRALAPWWVERGDWDEARRWLERALERTPAPDGLVADVCVAAGSLAVLQADRTVARQWLETSHSLYESLGDRYGVARALNQLGSLAEWEGDDHAAAVLHGESITLLRDLDDLPRLAAALSDLGDVMQRQGGDAAPLYEESYALAQASGDQGQLARAMYDLALLLREKGGFVRSQHLLEESVALARTLGDPLLLLGSLTELGETVRRRGDLTRAVALQEESVRVARALGSAWSLALTLLNLGRALRDAGDHARAQAILSESLSHAQTAKDHARIEKIMAELHTTSSKNDHQ